MSDSIAKLNTPASGLKLESHMIFLCPECGKEHDTQLDWRIHLNIVHSYSTKKAVDFNFIEIDDKHHECQVCLKWVPNGHQTPAVLQYHRFNHLPYSKIYRCRYCRGSFLRKRSLSDHLFRVHNRLISKADNEPKKAIVNRSFRDPKQNKEFYIRFLCPLCGKLFERSQYWQQHLDAAHTSTSVDLKMHRIACTRSYYCGQCSYTLKNGPSRSQLQRHHFTHMPYSSYFQCAFCYSRKAFKTELLLHFIKYHPEEYLKNKQYVSMPDEWGGPADEDVVKEVQRCMAAVAKRPQSDILQRALRNSFINFEDEPISENRTKKFNHEQALDQSLSGYESVFVVEMEKNVAKRGCMQISEIDDSELEDICKEMFEEIPDCRPPTLSKSSANDSLQNDMQKYIHYLCPECGHEFDNQNTWRSHVYEEHNLINAVESKFRPLNALKTIHLCLVCYQVQRTSKHAELRRHHFQHMPFQSYLKCTICTKTKSSKPKMIQHLEYVHLMSTNTETTPAADTSKGKKFRCLECDKTYVAALRFKNHCRTCPKRLAPLGGKKYTVVQNTLLLANLQKAGVRIDKMLEEAGIDASTIQLPYK